MYIVRNEEMKETISHLWKQYLLSITAGDIMLGEVADQLYVSDLDYEALKKKGTAALLEAVVNTGFSDTIDDAVENLCEEPEAMQPYAQLLEDMSPDDLWEALFQQIVSHTRYYDSSLVTKNPYYTHVKAPTAHKGAITLTTTDYLAGEFFQTYHRKFHREDPFGYAEIGFFDGQVPFPVLLEKGNVWMSVVMSEIESMEEPIAAAHGKVITYGLGLGYYAFMAAEKPEVESVTVVEMNPKVISLFKEKLLPQFPHKEKIHIIEADALDFIDQQKDGAYQEAFSDFWGGVTDGLELYLKFMPKTARFHKTRHDYWIETCFLEYYFRPVLMKVLMEKGLGRKVTLPEVGKKEAKVQRQFEEFLWKWDGRMETPEDLYQLLDNDSLISLMRAFACQRR